MRTISFKVTNSEYRKIVTLLERKSMDTPTLFLSSVGIRSPKRVPTKRALKRAIRSNIRVGKTFTLKDLFSPRDYESLSFADRAAAGRKLEVISTEIKYIKKLKGMKEGRVIYKRVR